MKYSRIDTEISGEASEKYNDKKLETKTECAVLGFIYVAASGICFTLMATTIKWFDSLSPYTWGFYRSFVNFILNCIFLACQGVHITEWLGSKRHQVMLLFFRTFFGMVGMIGGFTAFQLLELGDASCFRQSVPIWASLFGWLILGEKLDYVEVCIISFIMGGLVLVARPSALFGGAVYDRQFLHGMTAGLIAAAGAALAFVMIKKVKIHHPSTPNFVIINWLLCGGMVLTYPLSIITGMPFQLPRGKQVLGVCLGGSFGFGGQILLTTGIGLERVGPVMSVRSWDIILMYLCQGVLWGFDTDGLLLRILGAFLIMVGSISLGIHKWMKTREKNHYDKLETELATRGSCDMEKFSEEEITLHLKNESNLDPTDSEEDGGSDFKNLNHPIKLSTNDQ